MKGLAIALGILLILWLIGRIRIGARAEYSESGFFLWIRAAGLRFRVIPAARKKADKQRPERAETTKETEGPEKPEKKRGGALDTVRRLLPVALDALKYLRRKLRADVLRLRLTSASDDPADAALRYGQASALLGALWLPLTRALNVVDGQAHVDVDFQAKEPAIYLLAQLSLTVGQAVTLAVVYGLRAAAVLLRGRRGGTDTIKGKEDVENGEASDQ